MLEGVIDNDVPTFLKNLFPNQTFLIPNNKPGIYLCFFPNISKVYIGQSKNIVQELKWLVSSKEKRPHIIEAFKTNNTNVKKYALLQGLGCLNTRLRLKLELEYIKKAGENSLNVAGNPLSKFNLIVHNPLINTPVFTKYTDSLRHFDLSYTSLPPKLSENYIYILINKTSKRFYIGETSNIRFFQRMKEHRQNIARRAIFQKQGQTFFNPSVYDKMATDLLNSSNEFYFSIIEYTDALSHTQVLTRESELIIEAYKKDKNRLYNEPSRKFLKVFSGTHRVDCSGKTRKIRPITLSNLKYPCIIDNVWYDTVSSALQAKGIANRHIIYTRFKSAKFPNYIYLKEQGSKTIPNIPEIQNKLKVFKNKLENLIKSSLVKNSNTN